jgi:hypothetical protein
MRSRCFASLIHVGSRLTHERETLGARSRKRAPTYRRSIPRCARLSAHSRFPTHEVWSQSGSPKYGSVAAEGQRAGYQVCATTFAVPQPEHRKRRDTFVGTRAARDTRSMRAPQREHRCQARR